MKVAGTAAEEGQNLEEIHTIVSRMERNVRTLAVAVKAATHPSTGESLFSLAHDKMEIGMGQHGEPGTGKMKLKTADETVDLMLPQLLEDLAVQEGENLLVILNGAGATTLMELFMIFGRMHQVLATRKMHIVRSSIGEFITTQEQAGFQMLIARMDRELLRLMKPPSIPPDFSARC